LDSDRNKKDSESPSKERTTKFEWEKFRSDSARNHRLSVKCSKTGRGGAVLGDEKGGVAGWAESRNARAGDPPTPRFRRERGAGVVA
jgi:hypothetical protein